MFLRWNVLSLLSCPAYVVHVSLSYSNVLTRALLRLERTMNSLCH